MPTFQIDDEDMAEALEALADLCTICEEQSVMHDAQGLPWCAEHTYRGDFINWGAAHNWPALELEPYGVAEGAWFWVNIAMIGEDDCVYMLLGAIEIETGEKIA